VRPNPFAARTSVTVVEVAIEGGAEVAVEVAVASTIDAAMTTCAAITRMADEVEASTTAEGVEDTTAIKADTAGSRTSLHHSRIHGPHHRVEPTLSLHHPQAGCRLQVLQAFLHTAAVMEDHLCHRPRSVQHGWADRPHSMAVLPRTRPVATPH